MYRLLELCRTNHIVRAYIERPNGSVYCDWFFLEHTNREIAEYLRRNGVYTGSGYLETMTTIE